MILSILQNDTKVIVLLAELLSPYISYIEVLTPNTPDRD